MEIVSYKPDVGQRSAKKETLDAIAEDYYRIIPIIDRKIARIMNEEADSTYEALYKNDWYGQ